MPVLTPKGFDKLQSVNPQPDEWDLLTKISGSRSLDDICLELKVGIETGAQKIFRFQNLGFVDFWPSSSLGLGS